MPKPTGKLLIRYGAAVASIVLAILARWLIDRPLGSHLPFVTFFVAVLFTAWYGGFGPSLMAIFLGALAADYFFVPPRGSLSIDALQDRVGLGLYFFVGFAGALFSEALQAARRRVEASSLETARSREWLKVTLSSIGDAVIATDNKGQVTFLNALAQKLTGWTQEEAERQPLEVVFRIVNEQLRQPAENPVVRVLREGNVVGLANHTVLLAKDGKETPIDDSAAPIHDEQGNTVGVVLIFRDVTERRRAEEARRRLAAIVEFSDDAIVGKSLDGVITSWNAGAERLYGYTAAEALGKPFSLLIPPDRSVEAQESAQRLLRGERLDQYETVRRCKDGSLIDVSVSYSPVKSDEGRLIGAAVTTRDISERKRAERRRHARLAITQALAEAMDVTAAAPRILRAVCEGLGWGVGALWTVDRQAGLVRCLDAWHLPSFRVEKFEEATRQASFGPDSSLPGRVWSSGQPLWMADVATDERFVRRQIAAADGLHGGFACPIYGESEVLGLIEFFSHEIREPDPDLLEMMTTVGGQLGQFIERKRSEERVRRSERELSDFFDNATVGLHWIGPHGVILRANQAELDMLGYARDEYVGHHVAEFYADEQGINEILRRLQAGERVRDCPARMRCKDGSFKDVLIDSSVLWEDGRFIHTRCFTRDVTDKRRAEEALRESEERFRAAVDQAAVGVALVGQENRTLFVNQGLCAMLGYSEDELLAGSFVDVTHPDDVHIDFAHMPRLISGEISSCRYEKRYLHKNGSIVWGDLSVSAVRDDRGAMKYAVGVVADITERKLAVETLRDSEARLQAILENTAACVFAKDLGGRYIIANRTFVNLFGWPGPEFVLGKTDHELHEPQAAEAYRANDQVVIEAGKPLEFEEAAAVADDVLTYLMLKFPLRDHAERVYGVCGIATDITERKKAEQERQRLLDLEHLARAEAEAAQQRYRELVDSLDAIVWEADAQTWQFTFVSQRAELILGYPLERWLSEPGFWPQIIHPEDREHAVNFCRAACSECRDHDFTYRAMAADGRVLWLRDIVYVAKGEDGQPKHLRGVMVDVTETKRLESALAQRAEQLVEADRRKDEFLATLAHELRNPLAPIRVGLEVMRLAKDDPATSGQALSTMERQVQQLITLVDDLLDVSRITRGKLQLRKCRVALADVVQSAVEAAQPFIDEFHHELTLALPERPLYLDADPNRLAQVISNLLNNAAKYTPEQGLIQLAAERQESDVLLTVKDTGIGIPPDKLHSIFEMFSQIDRPIEKGYTGLGIGLTLVKSLVEMHGGRVEVRSDGPNTGSEFSVRLPILVELPIAGAAAANLREPPVQPHKQRVLIVDDNKAAADMLSIVVKMLGHEIRTAGDGQQALEIAAEFLPNIVLLDLGMPKMNGYEAARRIREQPWGRQMTLIALTGWGQDEDRRRTREAGFDHHLVKPAEPAELQRLLADAPRSSAAHESGA